MIAKANSVAARSWSCSKCLKKKTVTPGLRPGYDLPATEECENRGQVVDRTTTGRRDRG